MSKQPLTKGIIYEPELGFSVYGKTLGEAWINTIECVLKNGLSEPDENRERVALQNFRIKSETQTLPNPIFEKFAGGKKFDCKPLCRIRESNTTFSAFLPDTLKFDAKFVRAISMKLIECMLEN